MASVLDKHKYLMILLPPSGLNKLMLLILYIFFSLLECY